MTESQEPKVHSSKRKSSSPHLQVTALQSKKLCRVEAQSVSRTIVKIPEGAVPFVLDPPWSYHVTNRLFSGFLPQFSEQTL